MTSRSWFETSIYLTFIFIFIIYFYIIKYYILLILNNNNIINIIYNNIIIIIILNICLYLTLMLKSIIFTEEGNIIVKTKLICFKINN